MVTATRISDGRRGGRVDAAPLLPIFVKSRPRVRGTMTEFMTIDRQFNGPPGSGHGGYVAGAIADLFDSTAEVTLRSPPPLADPMRVDRLDDRVTIRFGETLVAEAKPSVIDLEVPPCPDMTSVEVAVERFNEFKKDDFHQCFACGSGRNEGDGLRLLTGPIDGSDVVAALWTPHESFAGQDGLIPPRILWSALDCPGVWSIIRDSGVIMLLGRFTAEVDSDLKAGTPCTIIGWPMGREGRKAFAGTAIYDDQGKVRGRAKAVWIDIGKQV